ncbi:MAG: carbohydrate kinase family protein [Calditrichaceae bacterium]
MLIGTVISDRIRNYDGTRSESLGGLLFSINAFSALMGESDQLIPVCRVGSDIYESVVDILRRDQRIITDRVIRSESKNNLVEITYINSSERIERSLHPMAPLKFDDIGPVSDLDAVFVNMISGWDLELTAMAGLRKKCNGIIYLDLHSVALGRNEDGRRYYRPIDGVQEWINNCDILQLNEREFEMIRGNHDSVNDLFMEYCFYKSKIINLTLGAEGSNSIFREGKKLKSIISRPAADINVVDPTGCGDVYGAGFLSAYLKNKSIVNAAKTANMIAAVSGTRRGLPETGFLKKELNRLQKQEV